MRRSLGDKLGPYEITGVLGKGGMGEVYRATDTRLRREVAVKTSDDRFTDRFEREARAVAALNHQNICAIYDVGPDYLVMELVEGETLTERIGQGAIPLDEALAIARQIADALEAAHEKGIIHRDLKPDNIKITADGVVKVLDFGLARIDEAVAPAVSSPDNSPTLTMEAATRVGTILGTAGYMAPEQARGKRVDKRADIWAFGVVLYEMVTAKRLLKGEDVTETLAAVVKEPADLSAAPDTLRRLLQRCLEKDPKKRLRDIGDVWALLDEPQQARVELKSGGGLALKVWAAVATLALAGVTAFWLTRPPLETPLRRFSLNTPPDLDTQPVGSGPVISPNGKHIAFSTVGADARLWVQDLDADMPRALDDTKGASRPFWSPDSESLAFSTATELRSVSVRGGASRRIGTLPGAGGAWSLDGKSIVLVVPNGDKPGTSLFEVPADGGTPKQILSPEALPGGSAEERLSQPRFARSKSGPVLLFLYSKTLNQSTMYARNLASGQTTNLGPGVHPVYASATGHLIYQSRYDQLGLWARPFSPDTLQFTGPAFSVRQDARWPSVSADGSLAYQSGALLKHLKSMVWRSRAGSEIGRVGQPQVGLREFALSPDRRSVATTAEEPSDVWIQDLARNTVTRLTFDPLGEYIPTWSSSGKEIVYTSGQTSLPAALMRKSADGTGSTSVLVESTFGTFNADFSRDGRYVVFHGPTGAATRNDVSYIEMDGGAGPFKPKIFLSTPAAESSPKLSPNGRFVAYISNESGRNEIYIRPFPAGEGRWQASVSGGTQPRWRSDGKELFYVENNTKMMALPVSTERTPTLGRPLPLFESADLNVRGNVWPQYDVSADGQQFLTSAPMSDAATPAPERIHVVLNWYEEFRRRQ